MTCHYGRPASASAGLPQDRSLATNIVTALGGDKPLLRLALLGGGAAEGLRAKFAFRARPSCLRQGAASPIWSREPLAPQSGQAETAA